MRSKIQLSDSLLSVLRSRKLTGKQPCEELNKETKRRIEQARAEIKSGKFYNHDQVKKQLGL